MKNFELIVFDIDGTLTRSKQAIEPDMAELLSKLGEKYKVAIISGAGYEQFKWQILDHLPGEPKNFYLLPADGTVFCTFKESWQCENDEPLSIEEKQQIKDAFKNIFEAAGLETPEKIYGELVEDRGAQFNFSALGQDAPIDLKEAWDPDTTKRQKIVEILKQSLPDFDLRIGGTTSIEVTKRGIDKAYGLRKLIEKTALSKEKLLYVGDKLLPGGNDEPALLLGLECKAVADLEETKVLIGELLQ